MPKEYGHSKTLFKKGNKYFWSYKFDNCQECGQVKYPHKGKGLCIKCFEKNRIKTSNRRKITVEINQKRYGIRVRIKKILKQKYKKATGGLKIYGPSTPEKTKENNRNASYRYYLKNREALNLIQKINRRKKRGLPNMQIIIDGKKRELPWEGFMEKPCYTDKDKVDKYKKQQNDFLVLKKYYLKNKRWQKK